MPSIFEIVQDMEVTLSCRIGICITYPKRINSLWFQWFQTLATLVLAQHSGASSLGKDREITKVSILLRMKTMIWKTWWTIEVTHEI
jgi:hypothetical protein